MGFFTNIIDAVLARPKTNALGSPNGYSAGAYNRYTKTWNASPLGPNTLAEVNLQTIRKRTRDAIRDSAIAESAFNKWVSNVIGSGIVPHFLHPDPDTRKTIQDAWDKWSKAADYDGIDSFYGLQTLAAMELFAAGEVFVRFHTRNDGSFTVQLIESEQLSEFRNIAMTAEGNNVKMGIVFDNEDKRIGYDLWKVNPWDTIVVSEGVGQYVFIPADEMLHVMKRTRAGQLRPTGGHMTSALILLQQIEKYSEAERLRKEMAACFAVFITKLTLDDQVLPPSTIPDATFSQGKDESRIEPGTAQYLLPGEDVKFSEPPDSGDFASFMNQQLHLFAAGVGVTFEQLTNDFSKVNFSSIRAGVLEFRRAVEQYQANIVIHQMLEPVMKRWMKEAVLNGSLTLPDDYFDTPEVYEAAKWVAPGWNWVNPKDEVDAYQTAVRSGFISRTQVVREQGFDPEIIDAQQAEERQRAEGLGLIYDSDPNKVLIGRESQPLASTAVEPGTDTPAESMEAANG
ncbi:MAG TPA: phage portal protein [Bryobacteraceae bacterium]|jgi:lambda family phage portal protein